MIRTALIDNEPDATRVLQSLLLADHPDFSVVATFTDPVKALAAIPSLDLQVVFLDIEMPGLDGLQVLEILAPHNLQVVLVTAHQHYALKAISHDATDYLLKPLDPDQLQRVINKLRHRLEKVEAAEEAPQKLVISTGKGLRRLDPNEVLYIKAEGNYSTLYLEQAERLTVTRLLKEFQNELPAPDFVRVHNSYLVNTARIREYRKAEGGHLIMENEAEIPISRKYQGALKLIFPGRF
ncbi:MAG: LytR/AlgR family response regulator transcription factor [Salibacteraceae bacterium]